MAAELAAEAQLNRTLEILTAELNQCAEELLSNDGRKDRLVSRRRSEIICFASSSQA